MVEQFAPKCMHEARNERTKQLNGNCLGYCNRPIVIQRKTGLVERSGPNVFAHLSRPHVKGKCPLAWPEIPDKMAEFEPAQRYAAFSIIIEKQTWRNPWRAKSVHFQSTTHSCILSLRLFYTTPHSRNLGGNCTTSRESLSVERQDM